MMELREKPHAGRRVVAYWALSTSRRSRRETRGLSFTGSRPRLKRSMGGRRAWPSSRAAWHPWLLWCRKQRVGSEGSSHSEGRPLFTPPYRRRWVRATVRADILRPHSAA